MRVLHVDDESAFLEVATHFLQKVGGFEIHTATSVRAAMEMISGKSFDVIVSDYQMPDTDGIEFLKMIRSSGSQVPFILFTGKGREDVVIEALNQGADYYLQKGGDLRSQFHELASMMSRAAESAQASTQLVESQERFRRLADGISDILVAMDGDFRITFWNSAASEVLGVDPQDATGRVAFDVVPQIRGSDFERKLRSTAESMEMHSASVDFTIAGAPRSFDVSMYPSAEGILVFARDTTAVKATARKLEESEERYRALVEASPDAIIVFSIDRILYANPAAVRFYGGDSEDDLVGMRIFDLIPPEFVAETADRIRKMHEAENPLPSRIMKVYTKSKDTLDMEVSSTPIVYSGRKAVQTILRDVTERRLAEKLQRVHQEELRTILDAVPAMIAYQDVGGKVVRVNRSFARTTGIDEERWRGRTIEEVFPGLGELFSSSNKEVIMTRKPRIGVLTPFQARTGVRWARADKMPIVGDSDEVVGVITVAEDITDKLESERTLEKQSIMLDNILDAVIFLDTDFVVEYWNAGAERMYGFTSEEVVGRDVREVIETDTMGDDPLQLRAKLGQNGFIEAVFRQRKKNGEWVSVESTVVQLTDENGKVTGHGAINRDISERLEAEENLRSKLETEKVISDIALSAMELGDLRTFMDSFSRRTGEALSLSRVTIAEFDNSRLRLVATNQWTSEGVSSTLESWNHHLSSHTSLIFADPSFGDAPLIYSDIEDLPVPQFREYLRSVGTGSIVILPMVSAETVFGVITFESVGHTRKWLPHVVRLLNLGVQILVHVVERDRARTALRESEEKFSIIAETSSDCIFRFAVSPEIRAEYVSPAVEEITGYTPQEFYSDPRLISKILSSETREDLLKTLAMPDRDSPATARRCVRKDGRIVWIEETSVPVLKGGEVIAIQGIARDVTERRNYEEALKNINKKLNLLGSITRHDSLNQLGILKGWLTAAIEQETDEAVRAMLMKVKGAADSLKMHLEFTSQYKSMGMKRPSWIPLAEIVSKVTEGLGRQGISVESGVEGYEVYADPMLENVFRNLVNNSIAHGETVNSISFACREEGGHLMLVYDDNGVGIPVEEKERIFERGYGRRHGYGLYLSREILSLTGATIEETGTPKSGARFEIRVPSDNWRRKA